MIVAGLVLAACSTALPRWAFAQAPEAPAAQAPGTQDPAATPDPQPAEKLSEAQIEQLVAPIALYPDNLLSQILTASTYPLDVVMAARWVKENPNVKGDGLDAEMQKVSWDASVKGLASVPQVLDMMNDKIDWTQQLGEAFLAQPDDVSASIQKLRAKADATGNLKSSKELKVVRTEAPADPGPGVYAGPYIAIEPAEPDVVYVPVYDPVVVYGGWDYPAYRPFYWYPRNYSYVGAIGFGTAVVVGAALWSHYDWRHRRVYIDTNRYNRFNRTRLAPGDNRWRFNPAHRNVGFRNPGLNRQFTRPGTPAPRNTTFPARGVAPRQGVVTPGVTPRTGAGQRTPGVRNPAVTPRPTATPNPAVTPRANHPRSQTTTPRQPVPRQAAPKATPRQPAPKAAPRQPAPRQAAPRQAAPRQAAPRQAAPRQAAPRQAAPRAPAPRQAAPQPKKKNP